MRASRVSRMAPAILTILTATSWIGAEQSSSETREDSWSAEAYKSSRIYRADSGAVWDALRETLVELKIKIDKEDPATGVLVARRKSLRKLLPEKLELTGGYVGSQVVLSFMVPRFVEPGRVYLNSVTKAHHADERRGPREIYNDESIADRVFTEIDRQLGMGGMRIPADFMGRQAIAREWLGEVPPGSCLFREEGPILAAGVGGTSNPERIPASYVMREYVPSDKPGKVFFQADLSEDGVIEQITVLRTTEPRPAWTNAAMGEVMRWRYKPARRDGCPVPTLITAIVDFTRRN